MDNLYGVWFALGAVLAVGIAAFIGTQLIARAQRRMRDTSGESPDRRKH